MDAELQATLSLQKAIENLPFGIHQHLGSLSQFRWILINRGRDLNARKHASDIQRLKQALHEAKMHIGASYSEFGFFYVEVFAGKPKKRRSTCSYQLTLPLWDGQFSANRE